MELLWNRKGVENTFSWDTVKFLPWLKLLPLQIPGWVCDGQRQKRGGGKFFGRLQGRLGHCHDRAPPHTPNQVKIDSREYSFDLGPRISDSKSFSCHRDFCHNQTLQKQILWQRRYLEQFNLNAKWKRVLQFIWGELEWGLDCCNRVEQSLATLQYLYLYLYL